MGNRGSCEIGSCLYQFIKKQENKGKKIVFYCDNCGGQNKNKYIQSTRDITNFKELRKKFGISKVRYTEIRYIKSINQQNSFKRDLKENKFRFY